jgi:hypothetical protein
MVSAGGHRRTNLAAWLRGVPIAIYLLISLSMVDSWYGVGLGGGVLTRWLIFAYCVGAALAALALFTIIIGAAWPRTSLILVGAIALNLPMLWFVAFPTSFEAMFPGGWKVRALSDPPLDASTMTSFGSIVAAAWPTPVQSAS